MFKFDAVFSHIKLRSNKKGSSQTHGAIS